MPESKERIRGIIVLNIKTLSVTGIATLALFVFAIAPAWKDSPNNMTGPAAAYIVQAGSPELAVQAVQDVGGLLNRPRSTPGLGRNDESQSRVKGETLCY